MSLRTFTVFQDAPSGEVSQPKISRPNAMMTRSKVASAGNIATSSDLVAINKENYNPVTGERAAPLGGGIKKPKATVLATKALVAPVGKAKREKEASTESATEPELKKRKASAGTTSKAKAPKKDSVKGTKKTTKRTGLKKVAPMPQLTEEDTAIDADARCYELTVKPLADVSQAYEEDVFGSFAACAGASASAPEGHVKFSTVKESSVEPEIRDYYQPACGGSYPSSSRRLLRALSQDPAPRTFSTPERRQIYSAFTFSSPSAATTRPLKPKVLASVDEAL